MLPPDFRQIVQDALVNLVETQARDGFPAEARIAAPRSVDSIIIRCQRTWYGVSTINQYLSGGDFAACVAQYERDGDLYSFFVEAVRAPGKTIWRAAGSSGGKWPRARRDRAGGFMLAGGSHVCVGGIGTVPDGGTLRVEMADGTLYEEQAVDGCAIVFAPVTTPPTPDDHVTARILAADGTELSADRVHIGDGRPPPGVRPRP